MAYHSWYWLICIPCGGDAARKLRAWSRDMSRDQYRYRVEWRGIDEGLNLWSTYTKKDAIKLARTIMRRRPPGAEVAIYRLDDGECVTRVSRKFNVMSQRWRQEWSNS